MDTTSPMCETVRDLRDAVARGEVVTVRALSARGDRALPEHLRTWTVREHASWFAPEDGHVVMTEVITRSGQWVRVAVRTRQSSRMVRGERITFPAGTVLAVDRAAKRHAQTGDPRKGRIGLRGVTVTQRQPREACVFGTVSNAASRVPDATEMHGLAQRGGSGALHTPGTLTSQTRKGGTRIVRQGVTPRWTGDRARDIPGSGHAAPITATGSECRDDDIEAIRAQASREAAPVSERVMTLVAQRRAMRDALSGITRASAQRARELAAETAERCGVA